MNYGSVGSSSLLLRGGEEVNSEEKKLCARKGCEEEFVSKKHNQKYHNDECCRLATNAKIMENYYETRARRLGKPRTCKSCNVTKLSRYNEDKICSSCKSQSLLDTNNSVIDMLNRAIA